MATGLDFCVWVDVPAMATTSAMAAIPCSRTLAARAWEPARATSGMGEGGGPMRTSLEMTPGLERTKESAIRQPIEWAIMVTPLSRPAYWKTPWRSAAKEEMLAGDGGVGERPWPGRSNKWSEHAVERERVDIKGLKKE